MKTSRGKLLSIMLTVSLILALFAFNVSASSAQTVFAIEVGDTVFSAGSTSYVNVPVFVTQNTNGFVDMQFSIKFDPQIFESANAVSVPSDSILYYAPDANDLSSTEKPIIAAGADNTNGIIRVAVAGVFQKNTSGENQQYIFAQTGRLFNLRLKIKSGIEYISTSAPSVEVLVTDEGETPFIVRTSTASGSEIPFSSITSKSGTMTVETSPTVSSLAIKYSGSTVQKPSEVQNVIFTAAPVCSGIYAQSNIEWYVNDVLTANGAEFSYTPQAVEGSYSVKAKLGGVESREIIISVGQLKLPDVPEKIEGKAFVGYNVKVNGYSLLLPANAMFMGTANELKEAEPVFITIKMEKGAQVKLSAPAGLRFTANINAEDYETIEALAGTYGIETGILIAPTDYIGTRFSELSINALEEWSGSCINVNSDAVKNGDVYSFAGTVWNIQSANYNREFSARAYAKITYSDGSFIYCCSDYSSEENSRSVSEVAYAALTDETTDYTAEERTVLRSFTDNVVSADPNGTLVWEGKAGYEPPYTAAASEAQIIITARDGYIWTPERVFGVTLSGTRLSSDEYLISGTKLIIPIL